MDAIVSQLKDVGANLTRTHYLFNEGLLERFDEAGILVWNEAPVFQRDRRLRTAAGRSEALGQLKRTIVEARDHPSVLVNSVGNELAARADETPGTSSYITAAAALAKRLDPTVPVGLAIRTIPGTPPQRAYEGVDVLGFNNYLGWYPCPPNPPTSVGQLLPFIDELRAEYPRQALLLSEFGAEATRNGAATEKDTFQFQSTYVGQVLDAVDQRPFVAGTVYWTLREFAVSRRWDGGSCRPRSQDTAIHRKGLLDYRTAAAKPAWSVLRARYQGTPLYGAGG
jgi:beta-galactosidase/beta-glucuronidase